MSTLLTTQYGIGDPTEGKGLEYFQASAGWQCDFEHLLQSGKKNEALKLAEAMGDKVKAAVALENQG